MNPESLISVALLTYNGGEYLKRSLESILRQEYVKFEVLVIDNGSIDEKTKYYIDIFSKRGVRVISNAENLGYTKGKNIAVKNTLGSHVLLVDDDIVLPGEDYLKNLLEAYSGLKNAAFLAPLLVDEGKSDTRYYGISFTRYGMDIFRKAIPLESFSHKERISSISSYHGGAVFFEKITWDKLGGYDESQPIMLDDFDLGLRARILGYNNYLYTEVPVLHIGKAKDQDKKRFAWKFRYYYSGFATTILKNYSKRNIFSVLPIFSLFSFGLMLYLTLFKLNLYIPGAFIDSYINFIRHIPVALKDRQKIQAMRVNGDDVIFSHV